MQYQAAPGVYTELRPARLRLDPVTPGGYTELRSARLRLEAIPGFARAMIFQFVKKGASRPLGKVFMRRTVFLF